MAQWVNLQSKHHQFDSHSGHMPGLRAWSPVGGSFERQLMDVSLTHGSFSPFLSSYFPLSLKIKKEKL